MTEPQMATIAELIAMALRARDDSGELAGIRAEVAELCAQFPVYADR
jgi:glycine/serine hydroxymethyltransferase